MVVSSKCAEPRPKKTDARTVRVFGTISSGASDDRRGRINRYIQSNRTGRIKTPNKILKQMVECLWGLVMRQGMQSKCLIFSSTAAEKRKFVCESYRVAIGEPLG